MNDELKAAVERARKAAISDDLHSGHFQHFDKAQFIRALADEPEIRWDLEMAAYGEDNKIAAVLKRLAEIVK